MTFIKRKFCRTGIRNKPPIPRGGETNAAAFPSGPTEETVEVQAGGPGSATLTVSFRGSGALTNYACETSVDITAWDIDIDVDTDNDGGGVDPSDNGEDAYEEYAPGLILTVTNSLAEGAGGRYPVRLSGGFLGFTGTVRLAKSGGDGAVRVWTNTASGAPEAALPMEWDLSRGEAPPARVWVDGVSPGAVTLAYSGVCGGRTLAVDSVRLTVITPASHAPGGGDFAAIWAPLYTMSNANDENNLGWSDGQFLADELVGQGWPEVTLYKDASGDTDLNLGTCTFENYLNMRNAGVVCVTASHGEPGYHHAVYAPYTAAGKALIESWCTNHVGMTYYEKEPTMGDTNSPGYYSAKVSSAWFQSGWKPSLDTKRAIVSWNICFSATGAGSLSSVKEAAGGRWRIGYANATTGFEGSWVNGTFFTYMNGKSGGGLRRTAGAAFADGSEYPANVRMSGNPWTTLCPAPAASGAWTPDAMVPAGRKGWGCLIFDTYMSDACPAAQVFSGDGISDVRWVNLGAGLRAVGFHYDKAAVNPVWLNVNTRDCVSEGPGGGRSVDYDRVSPNGETGGVWIF